MAAQIIVTAGGEELVVLPRRKYDALLARLGDEEAEDRMARRLVDEAAGEPRLPAWLGEAIARGEAPIKAARKRAGLTQMALAARAGIGQGYLSDLERGAKRGPDDLIARIAAVLDMEPD